MRNSRPEPKQEMTDSNYRLNRSGTGKKRRLRDLENEISDGLDYYQGFNEPKKKVKKTQFVPQDNRLPPKNVNR